MTVTFIKRQSTKNQFKNTHNPYNNITICHPHYITKHKSMIKTLIIPDFILYSIFIISKILLYI